MKRPLTVALVVICAALFASHPALAQLSRQEPGLVWMGAVGQEGEPVSRPADGKKAIAGVENDSHAGPARVFTSAPPGGWTTGGPYGGTVHALAIDPTTPTTLYAGTYIGVFKSTDAGGTWVAASRGLTAESIRALAINPATPTTLYAGTHYEGVFKSTDAGGTWVAANTGLTAEIGRAHV